MRFCQTNERDSVDDFFTKLQDEDYFHEFVTSYFSQIPTEMAEILECKPIVDDEAVKFAYGEYQQNIRSFAFQLDSKDPDHYKRAGSLLHALYTFPVISDVGFAADLEDIECGFGPVQIHHADINGGELDFAQFYDEYHNQMLAFMFAFQSCAAYEPDPRDYDFNFLRTMCVYMGNNSNLSLETFFMIFKALMYR